MSDNTIMTKHKTSQEERERIAELYRSGLSAQEVKENTGAIISTRQIQRIATAYGAIRSGPDAFRNAILRGRVPYDKLRTGKKPRHTINAGLRWRILERDNFKCQACGNTGVECPLNIDHIDQIPTNNSPENLRTLCRDCNIGRG